MHPRKISSCTAKQILDSRGKATIEVTVTAGDIEPVSASASVPAGKSTGTGEAFVVRDEDGGAVKAIENVENVIGPAIKGMPINSEGVDHRMLELDISPDKHHIGANAMLGVSLAMLRVEAQVLGVPLWKQISDRSRFERGKPLLYMNTLNGGVHADFCLPFQEYILVVGGETIAASDKKAREVFQKVKEKLDQIKNEYSIGDEGGFAARFEGIEEPFALLTECINKDKDIFIAIDAAASEFAEKDRYRVLGQNIGRGELFTIYKSLIERFDLRSIEDPFAEKDLTGFEEAVRWFGDNVLVVADDLTTTNPITIKKYGLRKLATAVIIKPNQIGTMFEVFEAIRIAREFGWKIIVSHRSGETMDPFIADLAVGVGAYGIKAGAHSQPERLAKYNRLLEIEKEMEQYPLERKHPLLSSS